MKLALKIILILTVTAYLGFALFRLCRPADDLVCNGITIVLEGDSTEMRLINEQGVLDLMHREKIEPEGQVFADIDLLTIDSILSASPYIAEANCNATPSGRLCVRIATNQPMLHVLNDNGDEYILGRQGEIMPVGGLVHNLCVVTGAMSRQWASENLQELGNFLLDDPYWRLQAEQVVVDKKGHIIIVPRVSGHVIEIGKPNDVQAKLERVRTFYEKGMPRAGWNKYKAINATFDNQIICTK